MKSSTETLEWLKSSASKDLSTRALNVLSIWVRYREEMGLPGGVEFLEECVTPDGLFFKDPAEGIDKVRNCGVVTLREIRDYLGMPEPPKKSKCSRCNGSGWV